MTMSGTIAVLLQCMGCDSASASRRMAASGRRNHV